MSTDKVTDAVIEEIARAWASIDGKSKQFDDCKADASLEDEFGHYGGYMAEARELVRRSPSLLAAFSEAEQQPVAWQPLGHISAYGLEKLQTRNHYCVSVSHAAEKEYVIPIYLSRPPAKREAGETPPPESQTLVTLADCPIGLFRCGGELCLKTEYGSNEGRIDAYIVSSGEFFWGGTNKPMAQRQVMVEPVSEIAVAPTPESHVERRTFQIGDMVRKRSGSWWEGRVVGFYSTEQTPDGVCVQLDKPMGPVQIYPASALATTEGSDNG